MSEGRQQLPHPHAAPMAPRQCKGVPLLRQQAKVEIYIAGRHRAKRKRGERRDRSLGFCFVVFFFSIIVFVVHF